MRFGDLFERESVRDLRFDQAPLQKFHETVQVGSRSHRAAEDRLILEEEPSQMN